VFRRRSTPSLLSWVLYHQMRARMRRLKPMGARAPDDAIAVMPNHFNLHGLNDYPEQFYPADLVTYAVSRGWYKPAKDGDFSDFDFAKAYQAEDEFFGPRNVMRQKNGLRIALDRPWSVEKEGMPFCIKANRPVTPQMMAEILSSHYEGTRDCCAHFGPGLSPHDASSIRYICTGTTLESDLFILRDDPKLTTVMSSFGRPCQLPYVALHPLLAQPDALDPMADASGRMESHLAPETGASCWRNTPWWRMRAFETQAELLFSDVSGGLRALMERMLAQGLESDARLCEKLAVLLAEGDEVVGVCICREGGTVLTVTENGKGRRSDIDTYRITARGGKGIRNYDASKDKVAAVKIVDDIDDVLLSSQEGIIIRLHANEIPVQSRYGSGVRVMRLGENDKVMVLARTDHDDEAQTESIEADTEDEPTAEQLAEMEAADEASAAEAPEADTGDEE